MIEILVYVSLFVSLAAALAAVAVFSKISPLRTSLELQARIEALELRAELQTQNIKKIAQQDRAENARAARAEKMTLKEEAAAFLAKQMELPAVPDEVSRARKKADLYKKAGLS